MYQIVVIIITVTERNKDRATTTDMKMINRLQCMHAKILQDART